MDDKEKRDDYQYDYQDYYFQNSYLVEEDKLEKEDIVKIIREEMEKNYKPKKPIKAFIAIALVASILGSLFTSYYLQGNNNLVQNPVYEGNPINISTTNDLHVARAVALKAKQSVVGIVSRSPSRNPWFEDQTGVGSGVIVDSNGYILTNSHVINDGNVNSIEVLFENGDRSRARVLWNDAALDLAVVKVDTANLPAAELGNSDIVEVGEIAIAIGNPLGLDLQSTVTQGVISGLERTINVRSFSMEGLMQTDASINQGNSGGPLLNHLGQVIGINTAKAGTGEGIGFAIPINFAKPIIQSIIETGEFKTAFLGISGLDVSVYQRSSGHDVGLENGVMIMEVHGGSAAEIAGIREGDAIIKIDNQTINSMSQLKKTLYQYGEGDTVTVTIVRDGQEIELSLTFIETR